MLVVTDKSKRGILTAQRIGELSNELDINFKNMFLVVNRITPDNKDLILKKAQETGIEIVGTIYEDGEVAEYDVEGTPLVELSDDSNSVVAVSKIVSRIINSN
jgi:CO dehydrogenase maturation factor